MPLITEQQSSRVSRRSTAYGHVQLDRFRLLCVCVPERSVLMLQKEEISNKKGCHHLCFHHNCYNFNRLHEFLLCSIYVVRRVYGLLSMLCGKLWLKVTLKVCFKHILSPWPRLSFFSEPAGLLAPSKCPFNSISILFFYLCYFIVFVFHETKSHSFLSVTADKKAFNHPGLVGTKCMKVWSQ